MPRRALLQPRDYRLDDLLRRPLSSEIPFGSGGSDLSVAGASGWGFDGTATFRGVVFPAPLSLSIWVEGSPVFPAEGVYRPSHVTVNAQETETGLQISEDKFVSDNDVLVSVLSLRNPGEWSVETNIRVQWGIQRGEHTDANGNLFFASRFAPNIQDRRFTLASGGRTRLVFTLALASDDGYSQAPGDTARRRAESYAHDLSVIVSHADIFQTWADKQMPRFDCPDPWCLRAWYHACHLRRKYPHREPVPVEDTPLTLAEFNKVARSHFANSDFDSLSDAPAPFLPDVLVRQVLGLKTDATYLTLHPAPDLADWESFCVENYVHAGRRWSIVWDSPNAPGDAYDDGDKGFTIYDGDTVAHRQKDLSPCQIPLLTPDDTEEDDE